MTPTDPALMSAETLLALYARRALSPVEALQAVMRRVAELNPWVNAFAALNPRALQAAGESEARWMAGRPIGPLDGVPATVKDLLNLAGFPTRRGSRTTDATPAAEDAPAVLRLREAGAVLGVHEATASRRLTRIHGEVRERVEAILMKEHGWTKGETARSLSEAALRLDSDLELMLTSEQAQAERQAGLDDGA